MSARPFITCRELIDFIADYLERSLPVGQRLDFDRHLSLCESCRAYLDSYETTIRLAKSLDSALDEAPAELIAAILEVRRRQN
jgi:predicted anti-sigma-YlaC factor YlaD